MTPYQQEELDNMLRNIRSIQRLVDQRELAKDKAWEEVHDTCWVLTDTIARIRRYD